MPFESLLYKEKSPNHNFQPMEAPAFFADLNLDQVVNAIVGGRQQYGLLPFFYSPLYSIELIVQRQQVFRDLEDERLLAQLALFAHDMNRVRACLRLTEEREYIYHQQGWLLEAVLIYSRAMERLWLALSQAKLSSAALISFRDHLQAHMGSPSFKLRSEQAKKILADLSTVRYSVTIWWREVHVRKYESEIDYSQEVDRIFAKFKEGEGVDPTIEDPGIVGAPFVETEILDLVAELHPRIFARLNAFCLRNQNFLDEATVVFDREIQFFLAYLEYIAKLKKAGLNFCFPQVSKESKKILVREGFDIALAAKRTSEKAPIVCNDFWLEGPERVFVVSGPNQGGKTTFARMFGQIHYLASLGCPVPGRQAQVFLFDQIFTQFEKAEEIENLRGKLLDDLVRVHDILQQATPNSILILNEIFTSTTVPDAVFLGKKILKAVLNLELLCVCVTFLDELATMSEKTVSMVSTVMPHNPAQRTFKIVRQPPDGLSYALSIAERHRLTYAALQGRLKS